MKFWSLTNIWSPNKKKILQPLFAVLSTLLYIFVKSLGASTTSWMFAYLNPNGICLRFQWRRNLSYCLDEVSSSCFNCARGVIALEETVEKTHILSMFCKSCSLRSRQDHMFIRYLLHKTAYTKKIQLNKYLHFNKANRVQMAGKWALVFTFRPYTIINWPAKVKISTYLMSKPSNWSIFKWTHLWVNTLNACYSCPCCCRLIKKTKVHWTTKVTTKWISRGWAAFVLSNEALSW